jgi:cation diffusion facilitator family transporter
MFVVKFIFAILINSICLLAESFHTLADTGTSVIALLGFKIAKKAPDREHPFGHARVEHIATLIIAVMLIILGVNFILESGNRLIYPRVVGGNILIAILMMLFGCCKELMARYSFLIARRICSQVIIADGWHHRTDAFATWLVALAIIGAIYNYYTLDSIFGIGVCALIIYTGIKISKSAADSLIGKMPEPEFLAKIKKLAEGVGGVRSVHDITVHDYGASKIISMHVEVDSTINLVHAHNLATAIEQEIIRKESVCNCTIVHIEPSERRITVPEHRIIGMINKLVLKECSILSCHNISIIQTERGSLLEMHVCVDKAMSVERAHKLEHKLINKIRKIYSNYEVKIHIEPK